MTKEQLSAKINIAVSEQKSANQIEAELHKKEECPLMAQWTLDKNKLSEKQLIELGKTLGLKLTRTMRMDTMRDRIKSKLLEVE